MDNVTVKKQQIVPLNDSVLVKLIIHETSDGGIYLPKGDQKIKSGYVVAIGGGVPDEFVYTGKKSIKSDGVRIGDKVFLPRGDKIGDPFDDDEGNILLLLPYKFIGAIVKEE